MSPPPLRKQSVRILISIFNTPVWQRLFKRLRSVVLLLSRLFLRTLYRYRVFLNYWGPQHSLPEDGKGPATPETDKSSISSHLGLTHRAIRDGNVIPLDGLSTSVYPFRRGSVSSASRPADRTLSGTPNGRLTPSNRSLASLSDYPYSTSHSRANSVYSFSHSWPADQETPQIKRRDYGPTRRASQRQDSESSTSEYFTPDGSAAGAGFDSDLNPDPTHIDVPSNHSTAWDDEWDLNPTFPTESLRYWHRTKIVKEDTDITLTPLDFTFETFPVPGGWTRHAHPEGCCYFYNASKGVYTDAEIYDPVQLERIEARIKQVEMAKKALGFPANAEIVINIYGDGEDVDERQYYCLDHDQRVIFFFHEFHTNWVAEWGDVEGAFSRNHLRYEFESQYWYAVQMYPHRVQLTKNMVDELRDIVLHLVGDTMSSPHSIAEFTSENLMKILVITAYAKENIGSTQTSGTVCLLARFMFHLYHSRFINFHGEPYARVERHFSVYGDALHPRSRFLRGLSLLLLSAPNVYLEYLQKVWVDKILHKAVWEEALRKFSAEWKDLVTAATILLTTNMAFLAIQSVDQSPPERSLAQIFSYVSVFTNVGGMISALLLIRQYQNYPSSYAGHTYSHLGMEGLAIMFCLPYALLLWGLISFLAAFALMCLDKSEADTRITVGICLVITGLLISWFIFLGWETTDEDPSTDYRTLAYYRPKKDRADTPSLVLSPVEEAMVSSIGPLFNGQDLSQPPDALPSLSEADSVRTAITPAPVAAKPQPRLVAMFFHAFRRISALGISGNDRDDAAAAV